MASIKNLTVGQVLYDLQRRKMGCTSMSETVCYTVRITAIDPEGQWVEASWNSNASRRYYPEQIKKWRVTKPVPKRLDVFGRQIY